MQSSFTLFIRALCILVMVVLNLWFDNFNISAISVWFDACSVFSNSGFLLYSMFYNFFLDSQTNVWSKRNLTISRPLVIWWSGVVGGEEFCNPMIRSQSFNEPMPQDHEFHICFSSAFLGRTGYVDIQFFQHH